MVCALYITKSEVPRPLWNLASATGIESNQASRLKRKYRGEKIKQNHSKKAINQIQDTEYSIRKDVSLPI